MKYVLILIIAFGMVACQLPQQKQFKTPPQEVEQQEMTVSQSVSIPQDGSAPIAGISQVDNPDQTVTFTSVGEKFDVKNGQEVNIIYDGIDPEETYIVYESTFDGYSLELAYRSDPVSIFFEKLCQIKIVANPALTQVVIPKELRYEQIIWTPRADGTWEVRIGTTQRGCKSSALRELQKLRDKGYEKSVPK